MAVTVIVIKAVTRIAERLVFLTVLINVQAPVIRTAMVDVLILVKMNV